MGACLEVSLVKERLVRQVFRRANRYCRDGIRVSDALNLAFADFELDLPKWFGLDWVVESASGHAIVFEYRGPEPEEAL